MGDTSKVVSGRTNDHDLLRRIQQVAVKENRTTSYTVIRLLRWALDKMGVK